MNPSKAREDPKLANFGRRWTEADDLYIMKGANDNMDYDKMAESLKRTPNSVKLRIYMNILKYVSEKNTIEQLCKKFNVKKEDVLQFKEDSDIKELQAKEKKEANKIKRAEEKEEKEKSKKADEGLLLEIRDVLLILAKNSIELSDTICSGTPVGPQAGPHPRTEPLGVPHLRSRTPGGSAPPSEAITRITRS